MDRRNKQRLVKLYDVGLFIENTSTFITNE